MICMIIFWYFCIASSPLISFLWPQLQHHRKKRSALDRSDNLSCSWRFPTHSLSFIIIVLKPITRPGKHTESYWKWPSRNSGFSHWTWWCSIVFCMFTRGYISIYFWAMASRCVTSIFGIAPSDHRAIFQSRSEGSSCGRNVEDVHQLIWNTAAVTTRICIAPTWAEVYYLERTFC